MMKIAALLLIPFLLSPQPLRPQSTPVPSASRSGGFDNVATEALSIMRARADELKVGGVAIVAYMPGETLSSWSSKMVVVGRYKDLPTATNKGSNLLAIVYAKAAEMADTRKDSGGGDRPSMTGEVGWQGGVLARIPSGYVIAAFSGGKSEDDVQIARAGLARLSQGL